MKQAALYTFIHTNLHYICIKRHLHIRSIYRLVRICLSLRSPDMWKLLCKVPSTAPPEYVHVEPIRTDYCHGICGNWRFIVDNSHLLQSTNKSFPTQRTRRDSELLVFIRGVLINTSRCTVSHGRAKRKYGQLISIVYRRYNPSR